MKHCYRILFMLVRHKEWGNYSHSSSFLFRQADQGRQAEKEGEKAILDEVSSLGKGKTLRGIINFLPILTNHVEPPLRKHLFEYLLPSGGLSFDCSVLNQEKRVSRNGKSGCL